MLKLFIFRSRNSITPKYNKYKENYRHLGAEVSLSYSNIDNINLLTVILTMVAVVV